MFLLGLPAGHPWVVAEGVAPDEPLNSVVISRLMKFSTMNKLKKMALRVCTFVVVFI